MYIGVADEWAGQTAVNIDTRIYVTGEEDGM